MRRTVIVVFGLLIFLALSVPVVAHVVNHQTLKAGATECEATDDVHTRIKA